MRRVIGGRVVELPGAEFDQLRRRYRSVLLDVGTGNGKHVLDRARQAPDQLVIGLDASRDAMRRAATRAAAKPARGGLPNALFIWAAVERLPPELVGVGELHVLMPWGSLLRGLAGADARMLAGLAATCAAGARFRITFNLHAWRPPVAEVGGISEPGPDLPAGPLAVAYAAAGWQVERAWYVSEVELPSLTSSWTRRLGATRERLDVLAVTGVIARSRPPVVPPATTRPG